ncbi:hypothetical protein J437_LFUL005400 [Ladona fulva]|uniref:Major facilitator superfamily (MFS) profile domain-containing protein n=1 Tax=Ladona fulva TaxID=123851 RepID=A0A8K0NZW8_LADFU|nr:hypothetical protein J437_LFUL005400 [Ladona fulva]
MSPETSAKICYPISPIRAISPYEPALRSIWRPYATSHTSEMKSTVYSDTLEFSHETAGDSHSNTASPHSLLGPYSSQSDEDGEFDWDMETQGHVLAAYYYGYVATQLFGGYVANRWGGKNVVGPGIALTGLFAMLSPWAARTGGPWTLFAMRVLQGICSGVIVPGMHVMLSVWFPIEERASFTGIIFSSMSLGAVIGMGGSGALCKWPLEGGGWPMVFYFFGAIAAALIVPWWLLVYSDPESHPGISQLEKKYILNGLGREEKEKEFKKSLPIPWKHILTDIHVWTGIIFQWGSGWVLYTLLSDMPTYMKKVLHYDIQKLGFLSALPFLLTWMSSFLSGMTSQWLRKNNYLTHLMAYKVFNGITALGPAATLIAISQVGNNPSIIITLLVVNGIAFGAFFGGSYVNHMDLAINYAGVISGILHTVTNSTGIIIPLVFAAIIQEEHTIARWSIAFYLVAGISLLTYIMYLMFGSVEERPWNKIGEMKEKKK